MQQNQQRPIRGISNIIVFSHRLHSRAQASLQKLYPEAKFTEALYHCEDRNNLEQEIDELMTQLRNADALHGRVVITPPSLSSATALLMIAIHRETGHFPDVVNMLQINNVYIPSPEHPIFFGQAYGDRRRRIRIAQA